MSFPILITLFLLCAAGCVLFPTKLRSASSWLMLQRAILAGQVSPADNPLMEVADEIIESHVEYAGTQRLGLKTLIVTLPKQEFVKATDVVTGKEWEKVLLKELNRKGQEEARRRWASWRRIMSSELVLHFNPGDRVQVATHSLPAPGRLVAAGASDGMPPTEQSLIPPTEYAAVPARRSPSGVTIDLIVDGTRADTITAMPSRGLWVGRHPDCDLRVPPQETRTSGRHVELMASTSGTHLLISRIEARNGVRVKMLTGEWTDACEGDSLTAGCRIELGSPRVLLELR